MAGPMYILHTVLLHLIKGITIVSCQNTSTTPASVPDKEDKKDTPFPPWLIGVIVLTSLLVIGIAITIAQRVIRKRNERMEQYRLQSD